MLGCRSRAAAVLRDPIAADEVLQEFAYCFARGDFGIADPKRGRFRDLVKTVIFHLIVNYQRQQKKLSREQSLPTQFDVLDHDQVAPAFSADREFLKLWREELLDRMWAALAKYDRNDKQQSYLVLKLHSERQPITSEELARLLRIEFGRELSADAVRQMLHRSREKFSKLLIDELGRSIETNDRESIEQELIELDLLLYRKSELEKRFSR